MTARWSFDRPNPITGYTVGFELSTVLSPDALSRVSALGPSLADDLPRKLENPGFAFPVVLVPGQPSLQNRIGGGILFDELDRDGTPRKQLSVLPNSVTYRTSRYERWKEYWPVAERILGQVANVILQNSSISAFTLSAANKFTLNGDQSDIPIDELIRGGCRFVSTDLLKKRTPCHSFYGFMSRFDSPPGQMIDNINIVVQGNGMDDNRFWVDLAFTFRLILTTPMTTNDSPFVESSDLPSLAATIFHKLHQHNNLLFAEVVSQEICNRIPGLPQQ
jgi:uncharacterized protein (TIGR04255 family)